MAYVMGRPEMASRGKLLFESTNSLSRALCIIPLYDKARGLDFDSRARA